MAATHGRGSPNGIPAGPLGRIAVDVVSQEPQAFVYASIEAPGAGRGGAAPAEGADTAAAGGGRGGGRGGGGGAAAGESGLYRSDDARADVAPREHDESAADVLQPGAHRSQQRRSRAHGRRENADDGRRRKNDGRPGVAHRARRRARDLDRSEQFRSRHHRQRRRTCTARTMARRRGPSTAICRSDCSIT